MNNPSKSCSIQLDQAVCRHVGDRATRKSASLPVMDLTTTGFAAFIAVRYLSGARRPAP
jgi:hypothetical protein